MSLSVGQKLKSARLSRDLTLPDVAHETRIPVARLQQLEEDNLAAFGAISYARSFLQEYGRFLEVDVSAVTESLPPPVLGGSADYRYLTESLGEWVPTTRQKHGAMKMARPAKVRKKSPRSTILTLSALFILMALVWGVWVEKLSAKNPAATAATAAKPQARAAEPDDFSAFRPAPTGVPDSPILSKVATQPRSTVPDELKALKPEIVGDEPESDTQREVILKPVTVQVKKPQIVE
jgi:cytoskeletal protein RodZ